MKAMKFVPAAFFAKSSMKQLVWLLSFFTPFSTANAQQPVKLTNRWTGENVVLTGGQPALGKTDDAWIIENTTDARYVRLKNAATGAYLNTETSPLAAGSIQIGWYSAQWRLIPVGPYVQIVNRWRHTYLNNEHGRLEASPLGAPGWWSAQWALSAAVKTGSGTTDTPSVVPDTRTVANAPVVPAGNVITNTTAIKMGDNGGSTSFAEPFSAASDLLIYKISLPGDLLKSADGGHNWIDLNNKLAQVSVAGNGTVWGVTFMNETEVSTDGGSNWATVGHNQSRVSAVDDVNAWAVDAQHTIYKTADQGKTWTKINGGNADYISAASATVAWTLTGNQPAHTNNGGATWTRATTSLSQISAVDYNTAWGIGMNGELLLTKDGAKSWMKFPGTEVYFYSCVSIGNGNAYVVDKNLVLVKVNESQMK